MKKLLMSSFIMMLFFLANASVSTKKNTVMVKNSHFSFGKQTNAHSNFHVYINGKWKAL